jgi:hypothetical protein
MLPGDLDFMTRKERQQELLREAEREQLIQLAQLSRAGEPKTHRKAAGWLGHQMVKWGSKLQDYGTTSLSQESL